MGEVTPYSTPRKERVALQGILAALKTGNEMLEKRMVESGKLPPATAFTTKDAKDDGTARTEN